MLLTLATGSGKTIIATNLLWRLSQAGQLPKPALFLCDRDELREQAYDKLSAAFGGNARIHIATYQTLGLDDPGAVRPEPVEGQTSTDQGTQMYISADEAKPILKAGLTAEDPQVRENAERARENLLRLGRFDYLDVE